MNQIWTPNLGDLRKLVMDESYILRYSIHLGSDKMYLDMKRLYWSPNMKEKMEIYIRKCLTCAKVKVEYKKP